MPPRFVLPRPAWPFEPEDLMNRVAMDRRGTLGDPLGWMLAWPLLVLGSTIVAGVITGLVTSLNGGDVAASYDRAIETYYLVLIGTYAGVLALFGLWLLPRGLASPVLDPRPQRPGLETAYGAIFFTLSLVFSITAVDLLQRVSPIPLDMTSPPMPENSQYAVWFLVPTIVLLAPYIEEVVIRGWILPALVVRMGGWFWPILLTSVFFGLLHVFAGWPTVVYTTVLGVCAALARKVTGRLWAPILLHIANNALAVSNL
ncbi:type II CAAX endopeptidase family protein [Hyphobacterium sp. HN65]|uniref:Type II CAAX endopeptidase family protein n=1 Tax=Hyphobacterium lacteum TaxID=3116575 RepID=A0ABU7LPI1_9PROT|nr:type II CAAX endopeptidase family protein [Hyphobacterium sp. HN65]MEE2525802.1 type II CAAX endopeptidase family protein [Hyphobacterium sp. HN65]